jgi:hypothetical protein
MAKPISKDLYKLIKSLRKNEKGYIQKHAFSKGDGELKFIRLFRAIDRQEEYDESKLLNSEKYILQLPRMKIYLYERILDTIDSYYVKEVSVIFLRKILNRVNLLFDKGLYNSCIKQLHKAKALANRNEQFTYVIETLQLERELMIELQDLSHFDKLKEEENEAQEKLENLIWYRNVYDKITKLYSETILIRSAKDEQLFLKLLPESKFGKEEYAFSMRAKIYQLKAYAKYLSALDDKVQYLKFARRAVALMEEDQEFINQNILEYIKVLNNLIVTLSENNYVDEYEVTLKKLSNLSLRYKGARTEKIRSIIHMRVVVRQFYHHIFHKEFDLTKNLVNEFERCLRVYHHLIANVHRQFFLYALSYIYFIHGKYKQALKWNNEILNQPLSSDVKIFYGYAKLLNILIHFELGNLELAESLIPSTIRFLSSKTVAYDLEKSFIKFLKRKIIRIDSLTLQRKRWNELLVHIKRDFDPMEYKIMIYFDFIAWVESKINGVSFLEQLQTTK